MELHPSGWPVGWHRPRKEHCHRGHALQGDGRDRRCHECRRQRNATRWARIMADPKAKRRLNEIRRAHYSRTKAKYT